MLGYARGLVSRSELIRRLLSGPRDPRLPCIVPDYLTYLGLGTESYAKGSM